MRNMKREKNETSQFQVQQANIVEVAKSEKTNLQRTLTAESE